MRVVVPGVAGARNVKWLGQGSRQLKKKCGGFRKGIDIHPFFLKEGRTDITIAGDLHGSGIRYEGEETSGQYKLNNIVPPQVDSLRTPQSSCCIGLCPVLPLMLVKSLGLLLSKGTSSVVSALYLQFRGKACFRAIFT